MKLIIDTNVFFSALLKKQTKIEAIVLSQKHEIYCCQFMAVELFKHKEKILKCARNMTEDEILEVYYLLLRNMRIFNDGDIPKELKNQAGNYVEISMKKMRFLSRVHCF